MLKKKKKEEEEEEEDDDDDDDDDGDDDDDFLGTTADHHYIYIYTCYRSRTGMDEIEDCLLINKGKRISYICVCCRIDLYDTI